MRLINTRTLLFEEFTRDIPQYAILSHTWEEGEEVSFAEMGDPACTRKRGYEKVAMTCKLAAESGIGYAWVDTCCIDKSSSAELSEAINSMFRWYQRSAVCYVFLSDLNAEVALHDALVQCRWITRGWTLQELIAPKDIIFFDKTWVQRGHKVDYLDVLQSATGIDIAVLKNTVSLSRLSVAQKMSWAAHRETTRTEDRAYSLLGIFDVHMPLLYGEEERAFRRLQEEIIKTTPDVTIFGWTRPLPLASQRAALPSSPYCGILAESPEEFASSASLKPFKGRSDTDFSVTNRGIKVRFYLLIAVLKSGRGQCYGLPVGVVNGAYLQCIRLRKSGVNEFVRAESHCLLDNREMSHSFFETKMVDAYLLIRLPEVARVDDDLLPPTSNPLNQIIFNCRPHVLKIALLPDMHFEPIYPVARWDYEDNVFFSSIRDGGAGYVCGYVMGVKLLVIPGQEGLARFKPITFKTVLQALPFAVSQDGQGLQHTLLHFADYQTWCKDILSTARDFDSDTNTMLESLESHGIPRSSEVVILDQPTGSSFVLSTNVTTEVDKSICRKAFKRIGFSWTVFNNKEVPITTNQKWQIYPFTSRYGLSYR